jgi:hypothetical protein
MIPSMIIEPAAKQITCQSLSTATMPARPPRFLFPYAKRQPATPIRKPPFGPQQQQFDFIKAKRSPAIADGQHPWIMVNRQHPAFARVQEFARLPYLRWRVPWY